MYFALQELKNNNNRCVLYIHQSFGKINNSFHERSGDVTIYSLEKSKSYFPSSVALGKYDFSKVSL